MSITSKKVRGGEGRAALGWHAARRRTREERRCGGKGCGRWRETEAYNIIEAFRWIVFCQVGTQQQQQSSSSKQASKKGKRKNRDTTHCCGLVGLFSFPRIYLLLVFVPACLPACLPFAPFLYLTHTPRTAQHRCPAVRVTRPPTPPCPPASLCPCQSNWGRTRQSPPLQGSARPGTAPGSAGRPRPAAGSRTRREGGRSPGCRGRRGGRCRRRAAGGSGRDTGRGRAGRRGSVVEWRVGPAIEIGRVSATQLFIPSFLPSFLPS